MLINVEQHYAKLHWVGAAEPGKAIGPEHNIISYQTIAVH